MPRITPAFGTVPFQVSPDAPASFATIPQLVTLTAPGAIVRFVDFQQKPPPLPAGGISRYAGEFWFDANLLDLVRRQAFDELTRQRRDARQPMVNSLSTLISLYIRLYLRESLAVRKNWKENFEAYVLLELRPGDTLWALTGPIAGQPYYSPGQPGYAQATSAGVQLQGGVTQYYINFNYGPNLPLANRISKSPIRF